METTTNNQVFDIENLNNYLLDKLSEISVAYDITCHVLSTDFQYITVRFTQNDRLFTDNYVINSIQFDQNYYEEISSLCSFLEYSFNL